ncbi:MAG TPA: RNA polymerase sigma factor [Longimicrobiales bacterium]|nr:RNA polymerase sigma factor [Longimicrobiales bacterium]
MDDGRTATERDPAREIEALARAGRAPDGRPPDDLLRELRPLVCRWALMQTGDPDVAEDVAQEVLVRVVRSFGGFTGASRFTTWLHRVVTNVVRDRGRGWRRESRGKERLGALARRPNPVTAPEATQVERLLQVLMGDLTPNQRMAFDLVDLQGVSGREAAATMDMNESTFRVHLARARATIRSAIEAGRTA